MHCCLKLVEVGTAAWCDTQELHPEACRGWPLAVHDHNVRCCCRLDGGSRLGMVLPCSCMLCDKDWLAVVPVWCCICIALSKWTICPVQQDTTASNALNSSPLEQEKLPWWECCALLHPTQALQSRCSTAMQILLSERSPQTATAKLADFGLCKMIKVGTGGRSPHAPEVHVLLQCCLWSLLPGQWALGSGPGHIQSLRWHYPVRLPTALSC